MTRWIRLTSVQALAIDALSASNPGNNYIIPVRDINGEQWICSDVLGEPMFLHYAPALDNLIPIVDVPTFAQSNE